jgi:methylmalonyl-CoA mutase
MRLLTAVPVCDGHDSAVTTINLELARDGAEVIYLGYHCAASAIARAAVQEDVDAVGLSSYNGGHRVFFREVIRQLRARGAGDIPVFGGGGGTITAADERLMKGDGVDRIFPAGTSLDDILKEIRSRYGGRKAGGAAAAGDRALGRALTLAEAGKGRLPRRPSGGKPAFVVGVGGPGGAGKSTLIDELTARFLAQGGQGRIAILANDPSHPDSGGAILGDRVSAIYARDERVFFRSMATRGSPTGMSAAAAGAVALLRACGEFEYVFVESVGLGQDGDPFRVFGPGPRLVDAALFVLSPHYGGRIQLQKIAMLNGADLVALNKCDQPAAVSARVEIAGRLAMNRNGQELHETVAAQHDDPGTDRLFLAIAALRGTAPAHAA